MNGKQNQNFLMSLALVVGTKLLLKIMKGGLKRMNKKYIMFAVLGLFAIGMVTAMVAYYGFFTQSFTVVSAISISECSETIEGIYHSGDVIEGKECTISNVANTERTISISNDAPIENITVSYRGDLFMTQKNLVDWTATGLNTTITYTIIGEDFVASNIPTGYSLVYYKDNAGYIYTGNVIESIDMNLPENDDENAINNNVLDYCRNGDNPEATQCVGAKLWLVPSDSITSGVIDWGRSNEFYFETELIQYNKEGLITLSNGSSLTITPIYTIGTFATGTYNIKTTIA